MQTPIKCEEALHSCNRDEVVVCSEGGRGEANKGGRRETAPDERGSEEEKRGRKTHRGQAAPSGAFVR